MIKMIFGGVGLLFLFVSCSNIRSKQLVGAEAVDLSELVGDGLNIEGKWMNSDGEISVITFINKKKGEVLFGAFQPAEDGEKPTKLFIRNSGDSYFVNFPKDEKGERGWMRIGGNNNQIFLWEPDREAFRKLIAAGKIKGVNDVKKEPKVGITELPPGAVIDDPKGEWVKKIIAGEFGVLFEWQQPIVFTRVRPAEKAKPEK